VSYRGERAFLAGELLRLEAEHLEGLIEWYGLTDEYHTKRTRATKLLITDVWNNGACLKRGRCVNPSFGDAIDWVTPRERGRRVLGLRGISPHIHDIRRVERWLAAPRFTGDTSQKGQR
jgi:hypothetical protein